MENFRKGMLAMAVISAIALSVAGGSFFAIGVNPLTTGFARQAYSQESADLPASSKALPTIRVTGDASKTLTPDQATITINVQTQPGNLDDVLEDQSTKIEQVMQTIRNAAGSNAKVTIGYQNISPNYSGSGVQPSSNVTFNVYASVRIDTNIDQLSNLVNKLAEEGFGFESVYIDPIYSAGVLREAGILQEFTPDGNESATEENPIAIAVSINTKPDVLTKAIAEYEEQYRKLLGVLEEVGVSEPQVQQSSFNIYPLFYGPTQNSGYSANAQIIVVTDIDNIESVTEAAQGVGNSFVENVIISVSDVTIDEARAELSREAISNARDRAEEMAAPLGLNVTGIKGIEADTSQTPNQYGGEIAYRGVRILQPYAFQSVAGTVSVSITVEFELAERQ